MVLAGVSKDPHEAVQTAIYSLREEMQNLVTNTSVGSEEEVANDVDSLDSYELTPVDSFEDVDSTPGNGVVHPAWYEQWADYFGFCMDPLVSSI